MYPTSINRPATSFIFLIMFCLSATGFLGAQPAKTLPAADDAQSGAQLSKMLKDLGMRPQELSDDVWQVTIDRDSWKVHVLLSLAQEGARVGLECKFGVIADPEFVPASAWLKLLGENERITPAHFSFDKADKRVHLYRSIDNVGLTPARLKKELEGFDSTVRRTQSVWRLDNFAPAETLQVAPKPVAPEPKKTSSLDGAWTLIRIETKSQSTTHEAFTAKFGVKFANHKAVLNLGEGRPREVGVKLDPAAKPATIDFIGADDIREQGIYYEATGLLTICIAAAGDERPSQFATDPKTRDWLIVLKRD